MGNKNMKTILVDAIHAFVIKGEGIDKKMYEILEGFPNKKVILTNANDDEIKNFLKDMPYQVFTLKHNPNKSDPEYYRKMLTDLKLRKEEVIYFEHDGIAVDNAKNVGINTYHYDSSKRDIVGLSNFLTKNL